MNIKDCERKWSIYTLIDPRSGEIRYVGWTFDPIRRLRDHIKNSKKERSYKASWIKQLLLLGLVPQIEVIETGIGDWGEAERRWIMFYRSLGAMLTNLTDGGDGMPGYRWTEEQKDKLRSRVFTKEHRGRIAKSKSGIPLTEEAKTKLSHQRKGKPISESRKIKLIALHTGKHLSEDHKRKLSEANKGRKVSLETRALWSLQRKGKKKAPCTEEHKRNLSKSRLGRKGTPWTEDHRKKIYAAKGIPYRES